MSKGKYASEKIPKAQQFKMTKTERQNSQRTKFSRDKMLKRQNA